MPSEYTSKVVGRCCQRKAPLPIRLAANAIGPKMRLTHRSAFVSAAASTDAFIGLRPMPVLARAKNATSYLVLRFGTACRVRPRRRKILCRRRNSDHDAWVDGRVRER